MYVDKKRNTISYFVRYCNGEGIRGFWLRWRKEKKQNEKRNETEICVYRGSRLSFTLCDVHTALHDNDDNDGDDEYIRTISAPAESWCRCVTHWSRRRVLFPLDIYPSAPMQLYKYHQSKSFMYLDLIGWTTVSVWALSSIDTTEASGATRRNCTYLFILVSRARVQYFSFFRVRHKWRGDSDGVAKRWYTIHVTYVRRHEAYSYYCCRQC